MQLDDTGIIALYFQRDESAIAQTEEKYGPSCRRVVRRILWDLRDVDECVSDTWLRTWNAIPPKRPNPLEAFLHRIARNLALDRYDYTTAKKRNTALMDAFLELNEDLPAPGDTVTDKVTFQDFMNRFLRRQSKEHRLYFLRRYWYGMSVREIAQECGVGEEKVKSALFRTRNKLRQAMEGEGISI